MKFSQIAWVGSEGVLYSRFPARGNGPDFQSRNYDQAVWFHRIGTPQSADELVFATPEQPEQGHSARVTADGRWAVITSSIGTDSRYAVHVIDLRKRKKSGWKARQLVGGFTHDWTLVDGLGDTLWFVTNEGAPRYRLVTLDLADKTPLPFEVVPQREAKLEAANVVGNRLVLSYLENASTRAVVTDFAGKPVRALALNGIGTAAGFDGRPGDPETFFSFSSFNQPAAIYRLDLVTGRTTPFARPRLSFRPDDYMVEQRFFTSKDGTRVPMFVVRSKAAAAAKTPLPTLLYGYGGFDISLTPGFSSTRMAWLESGGAFAMANLRGGGEYGSEWHDAGRLANKQNVFDDFIAAGEYLIAQGRYAPGRAGDPGRLERRTAGRRGGQPAARSVRCGQSRRRRDGHAAVRPLHRRSLLGRRLRAPRRRGRLEGAARLFALSQHSQGPNGPAYPAILVTTADTDDRVVPGHSFKYAAALQAADLGRSAATDPDRDARRPRIGQADRQGHRQRGRCAGFPGLLERHEPGS